MKLGSSIKGYWIFLGAVSAFFSVALGAFAAHGLKDSLDSYSLDVFQTAVQYQFYHSLGMVAVGLFEELRRTQSKAGLLFLIGIFLFSGSLYLLALTSIKALGMITPLGGLCFLIGWIIFARSALSR